MQTVITWTRYDGTPETLPEAHRDVLVVEAGESQPSPWSATIRDYGGGTVTWDYDHHEATVMRGDLWAPWPQAPEVTE